MRPVCIGVNKIVLRFSGLNTRSFLCIVAFVANYLWVKILVVKKKLAGNE